MFIPFSLNTFYKLGVRDVNKSLNKLFCFTAISGFCCCCYNQISIAMQQHGSVNAQCDAYQVHKLLHRTVT